MKISIIILSWNTRRLLRQCLRSLISNFKSQMSNWEIIVVDNGSTDGSPKMVKELANKYSRLFASGAEGLSKKKKGRAPLIRKNSRKLLIKLIDNRSNLGFAKGNNQALRQAQGRLVMLLNSDTLVHPGAIEKLADSIQDQGRPGQAVSPLLILPDGKPQIDYYMRFPNLWQIFLYHNPVFRPLALKIPFLRHLICFSPKKRPFAVDQLPGAALMASKETWYEVGLLDEDYSFFFEDVDWCWRAKKMGVVLEVIPQAKITHIGGASWQKKLKKDSFAFYQQYFSSMLLFVEKNYGRMKKLIFRIALIENWGFSFLLLLPLAIFHPRTSKVVLDKLKLIRYFLIVK